MPDRISQTGTLTTVHLALLAALAVLVILGILWGARLKRRRTIARDAELERIEAGGGRPPVAGEPLDTVPPPPVTSPPVTPAPPPLGDAIVPGAPPIAEPSPAGSPADGPVTQLKGLGPKVATMLADRGITTVGQIAALDAAEADALDAQLGAFAGRMTRDRWIEQARFLATGDVAGFEAVFGKL